MIDRIKKRFFLNLILLAAVFWAGYAAYRNAENAFIFKKEAEETEKKIAELKRKKAELEAYLAELQNKEAIEREAKSRLNLKFPGEEVVVVSAPPAENRPAGDGGNIAEKIKNFFKKVTGD